MKSKVAAVVVTYNKPDLLNKCLDAVLNQTYACDKVILIDNGGFESTESVVESFKSNFSSLCHINTGENLGGAGGFFKGIVEAMKTEQDFLWILDDDTVPNRDALEKLMKASEILGNNNQIGFLASEVRWTDNSLAIMNVPRFAENKVSVAGYKKLVSSSFVSMLVSTIAIKNMGLPIPEFFIWGDDAEFSRRISERYPSFYVASSQVTHVMSENIGPNIIKEKNLDKLERYFYEFRNRIFITKKFDSRYLLLKKVLKNLAISLVSLSKKNGIKRFYIVLHGTYQGFLFNPHVRFVQNEVKAEKNELD